MNHIHVDKTVGARKLDIKRCYMPGISLTSECPKCDKVVSCDFEKNYLSYPTPNAPIQIDFTCESDDGSIVCCEWVVEVVLALTLRLA